MSPCLDRKTGGFDDETCASAQWPIVRRTVLRVSGKDTDLDDAAAELFGRRISAQRIELRQQANDAGDGRRKKDEAGRSSRLRWNGGARENAKFCWQASPAAPAFRSRWFTKRRMYWDCRRAACDCASTDREQEKCERFVSSVVAVPQVETRELAAGRALKDTLAGATKHRPHMHVSKYG